MKLNLFFLAISILLGTQVYSQQELTSIEWENRVYDLGTFKEEEGLKTAKYVFTNTGDNDLRVINVRAGCGCTTPEWTREPVKPGETGFVKVAYNPRNRPGSFNRTATVTTNTENPTTVLRIKGNVIGREIGLEDRYPHKVGDVRLHRTHQAFRAIKNTQILTDTIPIVNMSSNDITLSFQNVPPHISIKAIPETLKGIEGNDEHGEKGSIIVEYSARKASDWGFRVDRIFLVFNGDRNNQNRISVSANIEEDFSHLTERELKNAPKVEFSEPEFEFGTLKVGEKASHNFHFTNTGKTDLIIRRIRAACGCTATNPEKMVVKPGDSSYMTVTFNSRGQRGAQNRTITVITNDPENPITVLRVKGTVEQ